MHKHWALALPPNTALVPVLLLAVAGHAVRSTLLCIVPQISLHSPCSYKELHCLLRSCLSAQAEEQGLESTEDTGSLLPGRADLLTQKRDTTSGIMPQT